MARRALTQIGHPRAAGRQARRGLRPGQPAVRRDSPHRLPGRHPQDARGGERPRTRPRPPSAPVRGEDSIVVAAGGYELPGWDDGDPGERSQRDPGFPAGPLESRLPLVGVGADVLRDVDRVGSRVAGHVERLLHRIASPNQQLRAALPERAVEIAKGVEQEADPVRGSAPAREQRVVEDEEGDEVPPPRGRGQRRVVANTQIPGEENDGDGHGRRG